MDKLLTPEKIDEDIPKIEKAQVFPNEIMEYSGNEIYVLNLKFARDYAERIAELEVFVREVVNECSDESWRNRAVRMINFTQQQEVKR